ncbi:IS5 family transposase [Kineococcus gypseus]|uniref:IS5 family transposase n=1 Tax=Kineococcus gypseus TaxID=1637102 RepID=UPI003D7CB0DA
MVEDAVPERVAELVPDELWKRVRPLLPQRPPRRHRYPGRLPRDDRAALAGIVHVLITGCTWAQVPPEQFGCSGVTCWRRLRDWTEAGVWPRLHQLLLDELRAAGKLDLETAVVDGSHVQALKRGAHTGPSPVDRSRSGSKHHLLTDGGGIPLVIALTGGNRHDVTQLLPLVDAFPIVRGVRGRPRLCPDYLFADRGYDFDVYRRALRARGLVACIARRGIAHGSGLGARRWVVERTFAWLHQFKRLRIRYEVRADLHLGLLQLACALICYRRLPPA